MDRTQGKPGEGLRPGAEAAAAAARRTPADRRRSPRPPTADAPGTAPLGPAAPDAGAPGPDAGTEALTGGRPAAGTPSDRSPAGTPAVGGRADRSSAGASAAGAPPGPAAAGTGADASPAGPSAGAPAVGGSGDGTSAGGTPVGGAAIAGGAVGGGPGLPAAPARVVTLTAGEFTVTVNPVDGSEIEPHRPGADAGRRPGKRDAASRAARDAAARPPVAPVTRRPLLERDEEQERLVRMLQRGRSVRLTGPAGSGRTALLDEVARACAGLAPDGVVRLSGYGRQQPAELLHALYSAVYATEGRRPDRTALLARVREIGAIVLLDDLELSGPALDELLRATPECAYVLAATPDAKSPSDDSPLEEVVLGGLGRTGCTRLLERLTGRPLTEAETAWAGDLRFASEGLPLRFVQAAALLRQRDELNATAAGDEDEEPGVFEERPRDAAPVPLPTLAQAAAPAELLASRVSESARAALRIACALGGELPHPAHLPALVGDTHADAAVAELLGCGLITPVGPRYRLAEGVARQLEEAGYGGAGAEEARTAARHYAWWTGHASVTPERVAAEADAVLAALAGADVVAAVLLARAAAPAFAASLHWDAWERVLRAGAEAARKAGEVAEQAYFHHELGVLALCEGRLDRARAELEASIGLRGALADKRGTVAGRRALALVTDREALGSRPSPPLRLEAPPAPVLSATAALDGPRPSALGVTGPSATAATAATVRLDLEGTAPSAPGTDAPSAGGVPALSATAVTVPLDLEGAVPSDPATGGRAAAGAKASPSRREAAPPASRTAGATAAGVPGLSATAATVPLDLDGAVPSAPGTGAKPSPASGAAVPSAPSGVPGPAVTAATVRLGPDGAVASGAGAPSTAGAAGSSAPSTPGAAAALPRRRGGAVASGPAAGAPEASGVEPSAARGAAGSAAAGAGPGAGSPAAPSVWGAKLPAGSVPPATAKPGTAGSARKASGAPLGETARRGPGSEAVTQVNPVIRRAQLPPPQTPENLSAVFGNAFPPPAPAPAPVPPRPARPHPAAGLAGRRRAALLGAAGALTVAALGTVIGLTLAPGGTETPQTPSVSSSPSAKVSPRVPQVPGTGAGDPAAEPVTPPGPGRTPGPQPGRGGAASTSATPSGTPVPQPPGTSPAPEPPTTPPATTPSTPVGSPTAPTPSKTPSDPSPSDPAPSKPSTPTTPGPQSPTATN
ncbi:ATP-binding protein [Streptomyces racemochromogenes]|uniref:ATP-binding protein n=1 Tax=Streptomyces racemochromogenes TaxID=67353 RepID=A0ABW7PLV5_9ACTN